MLENKNTEGDKTATMDGTRTKGKPC